jgi:hypothetical protein
MEYFKLLKAYITVSAAMIGMILGIYNLFKDIINERVRIKVIPFAISKKIKSGDRELIMSCSENFKSHYSFNDIGIEIINKSKYPIIIKNVGFNLKKSKDPLHIINPNTDKGNLPYKIEPRDSLVVYALIDKNIIKTNFKDITSAFVETACRNRFQGSSKALKEMVLHFKKNSQ